jgi:hypothetical protein
MLLSIRMKLRPATKSWKPLIDHYSGRDRDQPVYISNGSNGLQAAIAIFKTRAALG